MPHKAGPKRKAYYRAYTKAYSKTEKAKQYRKEYRLLKRYGLSVADRDALLAKQGGVCAICKTDNPPARGWCVDHDHDTNEVRGLLCSPCNLTLGHARDNPTILISAATYLKHFKG